MGGSRPEDASAAAPARRPRNSWERPWLIVANGKLPGPDRIRELAAQAEIVLAADGGADALFAAGLEPHLIIGDFDSVAPETLERMPPERRVYLPNQDRCDLDKALGYAVSQGASHVEVVGALGERVDHTLTAISLGMAFAHALKIRFVDEDAEIYPVREMMVIEDREGDTLSLIVLEAVHGVTLRGVRWPLTDAALSPGSLGVSNIITSNRAEVWVRRGCLVVCLLRGIAGAR